MSEASTSAAGILPERASSNAVGSPKRIRRRTLTRVDQRTSLARRIVELTQLFMAALTDVGVEVSPMRRLKVEQAASALAVAELARGRYMRGDSSDLDDLVRAERRADAMVKRLGLPPERPSGSQAGAAGLRDKLSQRYQTKAATDGPQGLQDAQNATGGGKTPTRKTEKPPTGFIKPSGGHPGRPVQHVDRPWEEEGVSRRTWERRRKALSQKDEVAP